MNTVRVPTCNQFDMRSLEFRVNYKSCEETRATCTQKEEEEEDRSKGRYKNTHYLELGLNLAQFPSCQDLDVRADLLASARLARAEFDVTRDQLVATCNRQSFSFKSLIFHGVASRRRVNTTHADDKHRRQTVSMSTTACRSLIILMLFVCL